MNTIAPAIKRRRIQMGLTQKDVADKMHMAEKTWRNIENGVTHLDIERLQQIAEVLEVTFMDLINAQESVFFTQTNHDQNVGYANEINMSKDGNNELYERMLADKDEQIKQLRSEVEGLKARLDQVMDRLLKG